MIDFVNHPDEHRRSLVKNLVNTIVEQDEQISGKVGKMDTQSFFNSSGEWFDHIGKSLYEKYVGIVDKSVMQRVGL